MIFSSSNVGDWRAGTRAPNLVIIGREAGKFLRKCDGDFHFWPEGAGRIAWIENFCDVATFNAMFFRSDRVLLNLWLALSALVVGTIAPARDSAAQANDDLRVSVARKGDVVKVRADFVVQVGASEAFAVLTDYDHMRDFLPGVVESKIIQRSPDRLLVSQSVKMKLGFLSVPFETVRQVDLEPPYKLVSHAISGTVSKAEVTTTLTEAQGKTVVTYQSEATLNSWLPTGLGTSILGAHVREQLTHMRAEMLRRQGRVRSDMQTRP
jgi:carbon monoxide dehydrogenase subunit G